MIFLTVSECVVTCPPYLKTTNPTEKTPGEMAAAQPGAEKLFSLDFQTLTVIFSLIVNSQSSFLGGEGRWLLKYCHFYCYQRLSLLLLPNPSHDT